MVFLQVESSPKGRALFESKMVRIDVIKREVDIVKDDYGIEEVERETGLEPATLSLEG